MSGSTVGLQWVYSGSTMNDERRKGEGNTLETSPFTHSQLSLATSKGGMWRHKGEGKRVLNTVLFVSF